MNVNENFTEPKQGKKKDEKKKGKIKVLTFFSIEALASVTGWDWSISPSLRFFKRLSSLLFFRISTKLSSLLRRASSASTPVLYDFFRTSVLEPGLSDIAALLLCETLYICFVLYMFDEMPKRETDGKKGNNCVMNYKMHMMEICTLLPSITQLLVFLIIFMPIWCAKKVYSVR